MLFIVASVISFCLKTHPGFRVEIPVLQSFAIDQNVSATATAAAAAATTTTTAAATTVGALAPGVAVPAARGGVGGAAFYATTTTTTTTLRTTTMRTTSTTTQMPPTPMPPQPSLSRISGGVPSRNRISTRYSSYVGDGWQETYGQPHEGFFYVELVCNVWFFVELIIRFVVSVRTCVCVCVAGVCSVFRVSARGMKC